MAKIYKVGGCVRDSLLGLTPNDIDYVMEASSFAEMKDHVLINSKKIFLEKKELGIIRYLNLLGVPEDISLCVKSRDEFGNIKETGTILEDLMNRDFTINAIARSCETNEIFDPLGATADIERKIIRCVSTPKVTFSSDPVRILRAIRFKIKFGFSYDEALHDFLYEKNDFSCLETADRERLRQELDKCFKENPDKALCEIYSFGNGFRDILFTFHNFKISIR